MYNISWPLSSAHLVMTYHFLQVYESGVGKAIKPVPPKSLH